MLFQFDETLKIRCLVILGLWLVGAGRLLPAAVLAAEDCGCLAPGSSAAPSMVQIELDLIDSRVRKGEFEASVQLLGKSVHQEERAGKVQKVLEEYLSLRQQWAQQQRQTEESRQARLAEYRSAEPNAVDPQAVLRLLSRMQQDGEPSAETLRADPWVRGLLEPMRKRWKELESQGYYAKAYSQAFQWLLLADPNDPGLREHKEALLDKAEIERMLIPPTCKGQESGFARAEKSVFYRALKVLETNYIRPPDFAAAAKGILRHSRLLAEVLRTGRRDFFHAADPNAIDRWEDAVASLARQTTANRLGCELLVNELLEVNGETLKLEEGFLVHLFARGALQTLDPYTEIVWPAESDDFDRRMTGQFAGVGMRLAMDKGQLKIVEILPQTPAEENGRLRPEDRITAIDEESTERISITCAVQRISGPQGTRVTLAVYRPATDETFTVELERRPIVIPTLQGSSGSGYSRKADAMLFYRIDPDPGIGYVRIERFGPETAERLRDLLTALEKGGLRGLILDLRSNSGGLLDSSAKVCDLFLTEGLIVRTEPRVGMALRFEADGQQVLEGRPLMVLINEGTASGAEIAAAALTHADHPRAVLVGTRTYGKGLVQEVEPLAADGTRLKYTRSFYVMDKGRTVPNRYEVEKRGGTEWGIAPDVEVSIPSGRLERIRAIQQQLQKADPNDPAGMEAVQSLAKNDPQLAAALTILKVELITAGYDLQMPSDEPATELAAGEPVEVKTPAP